LVTCRLNIRIYSSQLAVNGSDVAILYCMRCVDQQFVLTRSNYYKNMDKSDEI